LKVIFFGTPPFAAHVLEYLLSHNIHVAAVITKPDRPKGRSGVPSPTPVKLIAQQQIPPLPVYQPELVSDPAFADILIPYQADVFVVVAYGEILKQHLLDMPKLGCINLHASLLPKYRGAAPIQRSIIEGEAETGAAIMHMVKKMDAGDIIKTVKIPITSNCTYGELEQDLCNAGAKALLEVLHDFERNIFQREPQDHSLATFAPKIELEDCEIFWTRPAKSIHNLVRGVNPHPGAWCHVKIRQKSLRMKIHKTELLTGYKGLPGEILSYGSEGLVIACGEEAVRLVEVQLEGKKALSAVELMRGIPKAEFAILVSL
jgi:methionyl-tRNA formyltransferase